jgi:hypothetical protein
MLVLATHFERGVALYVLEQAKPPAAIVAELRRREELPVA